MTDASKSAAFCVQLPIPEGETTGKLHERLDKLRTRLAYHLGPWAEVVDEVGADFTNYRAELFVVPSSQVHLDDTRRVCLRVLRDDMGLDPPDPYLKFTKPIHRPRVIPVTKQDLDAAKIVAGKAFFKTISAVMLKTAVQHRGKPWEWAEAAERELKKMRVARSFLLELRFWGVKTPPAGEDGYCNILDLVKVNPVWFPSFHRKRIMPPTF